MSLGEGFTAFLPNVKDGSELFFSVYGLKASKMLGSSILLICNGVRRLRGATSSRFNLYFTANSITLSGLAQTVRVCFDATNAFVNTAAPSTIRVSISFSTDAIQDFKY